MTIEPDKYKGIEPFIQNDAVLLGILLVILAVIFKTSSSDHKFWKVFYKIVPSLLLCYFIPSLLTSIPRAIYDTTSMPVKLIDAEESKLYFVASRYLLPTSLVFMCLNIDFKAIAKLGFKAIIMFLTGTVGIMLGGPIAVILGAMIMPEMFNAESGQEVWRGLSTVAGSWIGGGANQTAMKEVYDVGEGLFSAMVTVDVIVANIWMAFLLIGAGQNKLVDKIFKADASSIDYVRERLETYQKSVVKVPKVTDTMILMAVGFACTGLAHFLSDTITPVMQQESIYKVLQANGLTSLGSGFFWLVIFATTFGLIMSFTPLRKLEGVGASRFGSLFLYVLVATIGMKMNVVEIFHKPGLFLIGLIWISFHAILLLVVARLIKAPFFFVAVGSQANVGGAASAPIVASAFNPALAPVGVLLAVLGYALGTYGALMCAEMMAAVSP